MQELAWWTLQSNVRQGILPVSSGKHRNQIMTMAQNQPELEYLVNFCNVQDTKGQAI